MTSGDAMLLRSLRALVVRGVKRALELDGHCKSYEGAMEFTVDMPPVYCSDQRTYYRLTLDCYVLGPSRHYEWGGTDATETLQRAMADVARWIAELDEEAAN